MILFSYLQDLFREAVKDQIQEFRDSLFTDNTYVTCAITGLPITSALCHIDHAPPATFATLVFDFLWQDKGYDFRELVWNKAWLFENVDGLIERFREYHKNNAVLRPTYSKANLRQRDTYPNWDALLEGQDIYLTDTGEEADILFGLGECADTKRNRHRYMTVFANGYPRNVIDLTPEEFEQKRDSSR